MKIEYDDKKNAQNLAKHGVSLMDASLLDLSSIKMCEDKRQNYGETRMIVTGMISGRLHIMIFTTRGDVCRVISLRKANKRESNNYEKEI